MVFYTKLGKNVKHILEGSGVGMSVVPNADIKSSFRVALTVDNQI